MTTNSRRFDSMDELNYHEVMRLVTECDADMDCGVPIKLAFLRNITLDSIIPYLKLYGFAAGMRLDIAMGDYDNAWAQAMAEDSDWWRYEPDVICICLKLETLNPRLTYAYTSLSAGQVRQETEAVLSQLSALIAQIRRQSNSLILLHNFETPIFPALGLADLQLSNGQLATIRRLNLDLLERMQAHSGVAIIDVDALQARVGAAQWLDNRTWHMARAPYRREGLKALANEYMKAIRAERGCARKCLVLDCDNTLWGGIVGEVGVSGIQVGSAFPGSTYQEFQKALLDLHHRGVLLAVCSKNNEADVLEVFDTHPDMVLRRKHLVAMRINWKDKANNISEIADELNIGLAHMAFVDDSEFEVNLVRYLLPEVAVLRLSTDPSDYRKQIQACGLFDTLLISETDKQRTDQYRAERMRKEARAELGDASLHDYLAYLQVEVSIFNADEFSVPRIAQLTQRTNQFNLTTKRYSEAEIVAMATAENHIVRAVRVKDRFGDSGLVGVAILHLCEQNCEIDTFLLSCRVLGRGVEHALLDDCALAAGERKCHSLFGTYRPTAKNGQVSDFFPCHGFIQTAESSEEAVRYRMDMDDYIQRTPNHLSVLRKETK